MVASKAASEQVPAAVQPLYTAIAALTDTFCRENLNEECAEICRKMAAALARKRPTPLASGKLQTWAGGIVYAIAQVNFLFDKSEAVHTSVDELCAAFGIAKSTAGNKAKDIRTLLKIGMLDSKWTLPSLLDRSGVAWMVLVNGLIVDVRRCPREIQEEAFRKGYIPYIPADRPEESNE